MRKLCYAPGSLTTDPLEDFVRRMGVRTDYVVDSSPALAAQPNFLPIDLVHSA